MIWMFPFGAWLSTVQGITKYYYSTLSLRPRLVLGAGDTNVLPRLIALQEAGALRQVGDGRNEVSVTSVSNLVDAILLCMDASSEAMGWVYSMANERPVKFWELVDAVLRKLGIPTEKMRIPLALAVSAATHKLGFVPRQSTGDAVSEFTAWWTGKQH
jgi:2-alkyl-3-oxoalkanoate reductase